MGKIVVSYGWTKINPLIYKGFLVRETGLELPDCSQNHKKSSIFNQFGKILMP